MQNTITYQNIKINNQTSEDIKHYLVQCDQPELSMDLSGLNIFDAMKILVVSSAYHLGKHPDGKIRCHCGSNIIKELMEDISVTNLELV